MALGGGNFIIHNKILPGSYINFISLAKASVEIAERGYVALPLELDWGKENDVITVEAGEFEKKSIELLGYSYSEEAMKPIRELMLKAKTVYLYRLSKNAVKANNKYATALYGGTRGNSITIKITNNIDETSKFDVQTIIDGTIVDIQTVANNTELKPNKFVTFKTNDALAVTTGIALSGGTNGDTVTGAEYQNFLSKIENYYFNTLTTLSNESTIKKLFVAFTKRMREEVGAKFQTVLYRELADHEGIISVENKSLGDKETYAVLWTAGALGGCPINKSVTNAKYTGEYEFEFKENQTALANGKLQGQFLFHNVGEDVRVLSDINTFTSFTKEKNKDFSKNQTIRVADQLAIDVAGLFNRKYLGVIPNDDAGRIDLWKDIVLLHEQYQSIRAIENFKDKDITVLKGEEKDQVVIRDYITPVNAMEQLYMTVVIS